MEKLQETENRDMQRQFKSNVEKEGASCVPTPGHKTRSPQVLNHLHHSDLVGVVSWDLSDMSPLDIS